MYCESCGAELEKDSRYCTKCGERIRNITGQSSFVKGQNENKLLYQAKYSRKGLKGFIIINVVCCMVVLILQLIIFKPFKHSTSHTSGFDGTFYITNEYGEKVLARPANVEHNAVFGSGRSSSLKETKFILGLIFGMLEICCMGLIILSLRSYAVIKNASVDIYDDHIEGMALPMRWVWAARGKKEFNLRYDQIVGIQNDTYVLTIAAQQEIYKCALQGDMEYVCQLMRQHLNR